MKHLTLISLILILTACGASAPTIVAETGTPPPAFTQTYEATATYTPEPTATVAATATEARDPSIPAEYTKDASGKYTKIENGITVTWDPERNAGYSLMFDNFMYDFPSEMEGTYTSPSTGKEFLMTDQLELKAYIDAGITNWNKLTVTHAKNTDKRNAANFLRLFHSTLLPAMTNQGLTAKPTDFSYDTWFNTTDYTIPYTTKEGPQRLTLTDGNVTTLHIRADYKALEAGMDTNGFSKVNQLDLGPYMIYMVKVSSDDKGNTIVEIAPSQTDALKWTDGQIMEMYFYWFGILERAPNLSPPGPTTLVSVLAGNLNKYKYVDITRTK